MSREAIMKRLGAPTVFCEHCKTTMLLLLPKAGEDIYARHWHVVRQERSMPLGHRSGAVAIVCSQECARKTAAEWQFAYGRGRLPKMRWSIHGPYTPHES